MPIKGLEEPKPLIGPLATGGALASVQNKPAPQPTQTAPTTTQTAPQATQTATQPTSQPAELSDADKQAVLQAGLQGGLSESEARKVAGLPDPQLETPTFEASAPPKTVKTKTLDQNKTTSDVMNRLQRQLDRREQLQQQILNAQQPTEAEQAVTEQIRTLNQQAREAMETSRNRLAPEFAIKGEQAQIDRQLGLRQQGLADQLEALVSQRENRLNALTSTLQFSQDNFDALLNLQKMTRPDVLSTQTDKQTGEISAFIQDPVTGEIRQETIGQITPELQGLDFTSSGTFTNSQGQEVFWGLTPQGELVKQTLGQGELPGGGFGAGNLSEEQFKIATQLADKVSSNQVFKDMTDVQRGLIGVFQGTSQGDGFGDVAAINAFQRMIDPGATVRAEDVNLLQTAAGFLDKIDPKFITGKITEGDKLPPEVRQRMRELSFNLYESTRDNFEKTTGKTFENLAFQAGVDPEFIGARFQPANSLVNEDYSLDDKQLENEYEDFSNDDEVVTEKTWGDKIKTFLFGE